MYFWSQLQERLATNASDKRNVLQINNSRLSALLNKFFAFGLSHRKAFFFSIKMYRCVEIFILPLFGFVYHNVVRVYYDFVCGSSALMYAAYILLLRRPYPLCLIKRPLRSPLMVVDVIFEQPFFFRYASGGGGKWFRNIECDFLGSVCGWLLRALIIWAVFRYQRAFSVINSR